MFTLTAPQDSKDYTINYTNGRHSRDRNKGQEMPGRASTTSNSSRVHGYTKVQGCFTGAGALSSSPVRKVLVSRVPNNASEKRPVWGGALTSSYLCFGIFVNLMLLFCALHCHFVQSRGIEIHFADGESLSFRREVRHRVRLVRMQPWVDSTL